MGLAASKSCSPEPSFTAHDFNVHSSGFVDVNFSDSPPTVITTSNLQSDSAVQYSGHPKFSFRNVTEFEVYESLMSIESNAVGLDSIPLLFIKLIAFVILPHINQLPAPAVLMLGRGPGFVRCIRKEGFS